MAENPSKILFNGLPIIDVRSPSEFEKGHVLGAQSLPLFSDEERHEVGLLYKTKGQEEAIKLGLDFVGPKMSSFIDQANEIAPDRALNIYFPFSSQKYICIQKHKQPLASLSLILLKLEKINF